jgi:phytoene dehydrogenase-like protein
MGMVSFILCDIARELGATVATGVRVRRILPGEGVELEAGECIPAPIVVSNADPRTTLSLLGAAADSAWRARVERIPMRGCTVKLSVALRELPDFAARPGVLDQPHHRGQINTPLTKAEWSRSYEAARRGELPERLWTELYFPSACDDTMAPKGMHLMSVFAQYAPYELAEKIISLTGSRSKIESRPLPPDDPEQRQPDITCARDVLGWEPKVPLEEGLKKTIAYFEGLLTSGTIPR